MTINWFTSLKDVPWEKVLSVAPSIVERGKNIWTKFASEDAQAADSQLSTLRPPADQAASSASEALAALDARVNALERRTAGLKEESASSFEVVKSIASQHSELVHAVGVLLVRTRVLVRVCVLLALLSIALFFLILNR